MPARRISINVRRSGYAYLVRRVWVGASVQEQPNHLQMIQKSGAKEGGGSPLRRILRKTYYQIIQSHIYTDIKQRFIYNVETKTSYNRQQIGLTVTGC